MENEINSFVNLAFNFIANRSKSSGQRRNVARVSKPEGYVAPCTPCLRDAGGHALGVATFRLIPRNSIHQPGDLLLLSVRSP